MLTKVCCVWAWLVLAMRANADQNNSTTSVPAGPTLQAASTHNTQLGAGLNYPPFPHNSYTRRMPPHQPAATMMQPRWGPYPWQRFHGNHFPTAMHPGQAAQTLGPSRGQNRKTFWQRPSSALALPMTPIANRYNTMSHFLTQGLAAVQSGYLRGMMATRKPLLLKGGGNSFGNKVNDGFNGALTIMGFRSGADLPHRHGDVFSNTINRGINLATTYIGDDPRIPSNSSVSNLAPMFKLLAPFLPSFLSAFRNLGRG